MTVMKTKSLFLAVALLGVSMGVMAQKPTYKKVLLETILFSLSRDISGFRILLNRI